MKAVLIGLSLAILCGTAGVTNELATLESQALKAVDLSRYFSGGGWTTNTINQMTPADHIVAMRNDGNLDAVIKLLADSGDIRRVLGSNQSDRRPGGGGGSSYTREDIMKNWDIFLNNNHQKGRK